MRWIKRGLIYAPRGDRWWAKSHALLPTPYIRDGEGGDSVRVYFSSVGENRFGRIGHVDVRFSNEKAVTVDIDPEPVLDLGETGTFDDCGVTPSCAVQIDGRLYLYYVGFQRAERAPYLLFSGLAITDSPGGEFRRYSRTPILDRTDAEPFSRGAPYVMQADGELRMWYWSCTHWSERNGQSHYNTVIRHASSQDGIHWAVSGGICIAPDFENEYAVGRPCVVRESGIYKMWYSIRSHREGYTIGYAESGDGLEWERRDEHAGIGKSATGWDSGMVCYPFVFDTGGVRYMLYNGNDCGKAGFGYAVLEQ